MYLQPFLQYTEQSGIFNTSLWEPCTEDEMRALETQLGIKFPGAYREFLLTMGRNAGTFLNGSDYTCEELFQLQRLARSILSADALNNALPNDAFVFLAHQGYQFAFFRTSEGDNPPVYFYTEDYPEEGQHGIAKLTESFIDFLVGEFQRYEQVSKLWRSKKANDV